MVYSRWVLRFCIALFLVAGQGVGAVEVVDDLGEKLQIDGVPERVISLSPSNTELLFALGLEERIVGLTEFCNYPPAADSIEKVAGFNTVNLEKIMAAKADFVLAIRGNDMESIRSLRQLGIPVFSLDIQTLEQVVQSLHRLGRIFAVEKRAAELGKALSERIAKVQSQVAAVEQKPRVMWGFWGDPVFTAGAHTMIDNLFALAGGDNVGRRADGAWPQVGLETILMWAPEVIITTHIPGGRENLASEIKRLQQTDGWQQVPAVLNGRIYYVEGDWLLRPGPRLVDALEAVAGYLHPQVLDKK